MKKFVEKKKGGEGGCEKKGGAECQNTEEEENEVGVVCHGTGLCFKNTLFSFRKIGTDDEKTIFPLRVAGEFDPFF